MVMYMGKLLAEPVTLPPHIIIIIIIIISVYASIHKIARTHRGHHDPAFSVCALEPQAQFADVPQDGKQPVDHKLCSHVQEVVPGDLQGKWG
jgi:hypothetical protein